MKLTTNSISDRLMAHVQALQDRADQSLDQYPANSDLMPNDAIFILRLNNVRAVCDIIALLVIKSNKSLATVLSKSIEPHLSEISATYSHTAAALKVIIRDFDDSTIGS